MVVGYHHFRKPLYIYIYVYTYYNVKEGQGNSGNPAIHGLRGVQVPSFDFFKAVMSLMLESELVYSIIVLIQGCTCLAGV